jgi:hypothetical protein
VFTGWKPCQLSVQPAKTALHPAGFSAQTSRKLILKFRPKLSELTSKMWNKLGLSQTPLDR